MLERCLEEGSRAKRSQGWAIYLKADLEKATASGIRPIALKMRCPGMKKLFALLLALMAFSVAAHGQTAAELRELAKEKEAKQEELLNLETATARALQWNTGTFFRRVYGEDFQGIMPSGKVLSKAEWIASVENSGVKYASFIASDVRVRIFEETAVVTCLWSMRGTKEGRTFARQSRVTHVYVYGQRGWQAVSSQETVLPG